MDYFRTVSVTIKQFYSLKMSESVHVITPVLTDNPYHTTALVSSHYITVFIKPWRRCTISRNFFPSFVLISGSCKKQVGKRIPHVASNFCDRTLLGLASLSYFRLRLMFSCLTPCRLRFPCLSQLKTSEVSVCSNESILLCLCSLGAFEIFDTFLAHSLC